MKFAKELEEDRVPEWGPKYFNYKLGKKKIKAITRAIRNAHNSPRTPMRTKSNTTQSSSRQIEAGSTGLSTGNPLSENVTVPKLGTEDVGISRPVSIPVTRSPELEPLRSAGDFKSVVQGPDGISYTRYGSIIGSPPTPSGGMQPPAMTLPDPALDVSSIPETIFEESASRPHTLGRASSAPLAPTSEDAYEVGKTRHPPGRHGTFTGKHMRRVMRPKKNYKSSSPGNPSPVVKSIFSRRDKSLEFTSPQMADVPMEALKQIDTKQDEFWDFLDQEYDKIEDFYKSKEDEATDRLKVLREQLHVMRDHRLNEIVAADMARDRRESARHNLFGGTVENDHAGKEIPKQGGSGFLDHLPDIHNGLEVLQHPIEAARRVGLNHGKKTFNIMGTPPSNPIQAVIDSSRDYVRRPTNHEVPYRTAKHKLKRALQELYRGMELLKSYAILNRTAFRKINKKYDKSLHARPPMRYMNEKVNNAWFVQSDILDAHIVAVEDLYARYFEKGNHKLAVGKLRKKNYHHGQYTGSVFRNGVLIATGLVFGIEGLVYGGKLLFNSDPVLVERTSYLLQLYGGYFIMLLLFAFFSIACMFFDANKINYVFVFEFDTRHNLDWRQLAEFPAILTSLLGIIIWLNFTRVGGDAMYIYYPTILIAVTGLILFMPAPILYHKSREWFLYSTWRLVPAGLYSVQFRDFFLGDMFCSLTYSLGNIELFFCLYANTWNDPPQCNSNHSRLLGFFSTLPGIWRALQCLRRYRDTRNVFPHLVNCGKYMFTIMYYMTLSLYRIERSNHLKILFIVFAAVNAIYTSIWDLFMDFSLMDPHAKYPYLRQTLGFRHKSIYYVAMVVDPILRNNWIFYAIYADDLQHSSLVSFFIAFSEVCRRGLWTLLRVENEHCTNVGRFRASRDVPLPYDVGTPSSKSSPEQQSRQDNSSTSPFADGPLNATGADLERLDTRDSVRLRRRAGSGPSPSMGIRVGHLLRTAHAQDFERRKNFAGGIDHDEDDEDEDEEDEDRQNQSSDEEEGNDSRLRDQLDERDVTRTRLLLARARSSSNQ